MDQSTLYAPGAQFHLILSQDPDRYQLFDNIYSRVARPPAKKGAMKFILLLSHSVRCPLWLESVTVQKLSQLRYYWYCFRLMYSVLYCSRFHRHATLPLTNTAILANINNWRFLQREEQIPVVCNLYGEKNTSKHHVTSRVCVCTALCFKAETASVPSTESTVF